MVFVLVFYLHIKLSLCLAQLTQGGAPHAQLFPATAAQQLSKCERVQFWRALAPLARSFCNTGAVNNVAIAYSDTPVINCICIYFIGLISCAVFFSDIFRANAGIQHPHLHPHPAYTYTLILSSRRWLSLTPAPHRPRPSRQQHHHGAAFTIDGSGRGIFSLHYAFHIPNVATLHHAALH